MARPEGFEPRTNGFGIHYSRQLQSRLGGIASRFFARKHPGQREQKSASAIALASGLRVVANLCRKLIASGAAGIHFYSLNRVKATLAGGVRAPRLNL